MQAEVIHIALAFLEGFALIISPCILPVLPIILSGSLTGKKSRPLGIIAGFVLTFAIVTLFSRALISATHVSQDTMRWFAFAILFLVGLIMISDRLTEKFNHLTGRLAMAGSSLQGVNDAQGGFWSGMGFGALVGIIWTPCAGPLLAAVIVQVVIQQTTFSSFLTVLAFGIGAGLPMLMIALMGRQIMSKFAFFRTRTRWFRKLLGVIILGSVGYLVLDAAAPLSLAQSSQTQTAGSVLVNGLEHPYPAPEIEKIDGWINSSPLKVGEMKGKVILVDFWTYSCINCVRTLSHLKDWYAKYHNMGFEIIGVHSPEFEFEHKFENVKQAVERYAIPYPVALDNRFMTWLNYHNEYWPAHYLINKDGEVVYEHFGEGAYDTTENNIRYLLGIKETGVKHADENESAALTPETYLGYARGESLASPQGAVKDAATVYAFPASLSTNQWALQGKWVINPDKVVSATQQVSLRLHFKARRVFAVMGIPPAGSPVNVTFTFNGKPMLAVNAGADIHNSTLRVNHSRLYTLLEFQHPVEGYLELTADQPGLEVYTFTFG